MQACEAHGLHDGGRVTEPPEKGASDLPPDDARYAAYSDQLNSALGRFAGEHDRYLRLKVRHVERIVTANLGPPSGLSVLEFGCGIGLMARHLVSRFADYTGIDVDPLLTDEARRTLPGARFLTYEGDTLPMDRATHDVAVAVNVFHHIPVAKRRQALTELARVLRPGGLCIIAEHNPANPLTRWVVSRCAFDFDAVLLSPRESAALLEGAGLAVVDRRYVVFTPVDGARAVRLEKRFGRLPLGAQHIVTGRRPGSSPGASAR